MGTAVHQGDLGGLPISLGEAAEQLKQLAPIRPIKRAIEQAAKAAGLSYTRTFDLWYCKAKRLEAHEAKAIADALQDKRERDAANAYANMEIEMAKIRSLLAQTSTNRAGNLGAADRSAVRGWRSAARPLDRSVDTED